MSQIRTINILLFIVVVITLGVALDLLQPVLTLFLVALLLAYLIDPLLMVMRTHIGLPLWAAVPLAGILSLSIIGSIGVIIYASLVEFSRGFPDCQPRIIEIIDNLSGGLVTTVASITGVEHSFDPLHELRQALRNSSLSSLALGAVRSVFRGLTSFLLVFLFALLFLSAKHRLARRINDAFPKPDSLVPAMLHDIDRSLRRFISVKTLISLAIGTTTTLILLAFGVQFAVVWGLLTFLLNFIPSIGSIGAVAAVSLFSFAQFGGGITPFAVVACVTAAQILTGTILEPKLLGDALNLSLLVVFISLFFWGWLWGVTGALLAIPMTAALRIVLANIPATASFTRLMERRRI